MNSVLATPAKRRRTDQGYAAGDINIGFDSGDDSGDHLFDDYETIETVPLPRLLPEQRPPSTLTPFSPPSYVTQPTQILDEVALTPEKNHGTSDVQVAASSPLANPIHPHQSPLATRPGGTLASRIAPPGTAFRPPISFPKIDPIVDLSSDDDDVRIYRAASSDEESQTHRSADIKPSKFVTSARNDARSVNTNRFKEITAQSFYKPLKNTVGAQTSVSKPLLDPGRHQVSTTAAKRPADVMADAYGNASRPLKARQTVPAKAQPIQDITLDDIQDYQIRTKAARIQAILPTRTISVIKAALIKKKGNYDDAIDYLAALDDNKGAIDLTRSDDDQSSLQPSNIVKPAAKQQLKVPAKSIQSKWTATQSFSQPKEPAISPPLKSSLAKPRKRLVQGRRLLPSPRPTVSRKSSPVTPEKTATVEIDTPSDSAIASGSDDGELEAKVLSFFQSCTSDQLADIAGVTEAVASSLLSHKPFKDLNAIRKIPSEGKSNMSTKRSVKRPIGDKIVDTCLEMWKGYDAVDGLVRSCQSIGKPVAERIKDWGADVYGSTNDGELDLTNFDRRSENGMSIRDSGIGTPTSSTASADEDGDASTPAAKREKNAVFGQPRLLSDDVVLKDYQIVGVNWLALLFEQKLSCILADDMGLGKTCQVISFLAHLFERGNKGPHLVIVPGSTIENWLREFSVFCPKLSVMPYYGK